MRRFPIAEDVMGVAVGDVDADGRTEIVFSNRSGTTTAIDAIDGATKWNLASAGEDLALAQLDADVALEVIVSGPHGGVFDGATRMQEYVIPGGFGYQLITGRFGLAGTEQFATYVGPRLTGFGGSPLTAQWEFSTGWDHVFAAADVNADGRDELLVGYPSDYFGPIQILAYDPLSQQSQNLFSTAGYGLSAMGAADFTGDGRADGFLSGRLPGSSVKFFDLQSSTTLFDTPGGGPIYGTTAGDADGDGLSDLLIGSHNVRLIDRRTGATRWTFTGWPLNSPFPESLLARFVRLADVNAAPGLEVVVVGAYSMGVGVQILSASTGALLSETLISDHGIGRSDVSGIALLDRDGDATPELFILTHSVQTDSRGARIRALSLTSGERLWESEDLAAPHTKGAGVAAIPSAKGRQALVIAGTPNGLNAFDAVTFERAWSLPWAEGMSSFAVVEHPQLGTEIVIAGETGRVAHLDPNDRSERRSYTLPTPVTAIAGIPQSLNLAFVAGGKLRLVSETGEELDTSASLGPSVGPSDMLSISQVQGKTDIVAASLFGVAGFQFDPDAIFVDGFHAPSQ